MEYTISKNTSKIEKEIGKVEATKKHMANYYELLVSHGYSPNIEEFTEIVMKGEKALEKYIREKELSKYPKLLELPIADDVRLSMVKLPDCIRELSIMLAGIPKNTISQVYCMEIVNGVLQVSQKTKDSIAKSYSVIGNEKQYTAFSKLQNITTSLNEFQKEYNIHLLNTTLSQTINGEIIINHHKLLSDVR